MLHHDLGRRTTLLPLCAVALLLCAGGATAQFRQRIDLVTIDVTVVNGRGEPVTDLSSPDFEVLVDGTPRRIAAFRPAGGESGVTSNATGSSRGDDAAADPPERVVVLVVQTDSIRPREGRLAVDAAAAFIDTLHPGDRVAVRRVPSDSANLSFLNDRDALKASLRDMTGTAPPPHPLIDVTPDEAVSIVYFRDDATLSEVTERVCSRHANPGPVCRLEVQNEARRQYDEAKLRAVHTLDELEQLIQLLAGLAGPKHIVFISSGPVQTPDNIDPVQQLAAAAARARVHVHALQIPQRSEVQRAEERGRPTAPVRRGNSAAYALAEATGGMAMTPSDPRVTFRRLRAELSAAYELGIELDPSDRDGKPHRIEVRMATRSGLSVRARQQFVARPLPPWTVPAPANTDPPPAVIDTRANEAGDPVSAAFLARLGEYVAKFEREFSSAVAEERSVQLIRPFDGPPSWPPREQAIEWHDGKDYPRTGIVVDRRQLLSDVLLVHTPQGWIGYRDVAEVDGRAVRRRSDRVAKLFLSRDADRDDQLRRIAEESARYNIGGFSRTLNIPTLPLSFMQAGNHARFTFTSAGREQLDDRLTQVIAYEEQARPTLIGNRGGDDVPISGRLWIDAATGEVVQTEIHVVSGERRAARRGTLVTRYQRDPGFSVLVPEYMWEWYDGGMANVFGSAFRRTIVEGLARYTDYRKFGVSTSEISR